MMRRVLISTMFVFCFLQAGCDSLRFAPTETQKQNAWLHNRTTQLAADMAKAEEVSPSLKKQGHPVSFQITYPKKAYPFLLPGLHSGKYSRAGRQNIRC